MVKQKVKAIRITPEYLGDLGFAADTILKHDNKRR